MRGDLFDDLQAGPWMPSSLVQRIRIRQNAFWFYSKPFLPQDVRLSAPSYPAIAAEANPASPGEYGRPRRRQPVVTAASGRARERTNFALAVKRT